MIQIEIKHFQLVAAIAKTRNLTRAAAMLHISQPAASHQLRELEDRMGTPLFFRTQKKMILTQTGEDILASAHRIFGELNNLENEISKQVQGSSGELKIGIHCSYSFKWIPDAIVKFRDAYPNVRLTIGNSWKILKELSAKTWDIIVTIFPFEHESVYCMPLFEDDIMIIMEPGHPLALKPFLEAADFEDECYISLTDKSQDMFWSTMLRPAGVTLSRFMTVEQAEAAVSLVKKGLGISLFPRFAVQEHLASDVLVAKRFTSKGLRTSWQAARLSSAKIPIYQDAFIKITKDHLENAYRLKN